MPAIRAGLNGWDASTDAQSDYVPLTFQPPPWHPALPTPPTSRDQSPTANPLSGSPPASSTARRAQRNRERDPSWVPRPRNAFFQFRNHFINEHKKAKENGQVGSTAKDKTLSKAAGDAWKALSPEQQDHWRRLADDERVEHARMHPHYRFQPRRNSDRGQRPRSHLRIETCSQDDDTESVGSRSSMGPDPSQVYDPRPFTPPMSASPVATSPFQFPPSVCRSVAPTPARSASLPALDSMFSPLTLSCSSCPSTPETEPIAIRSSPLKHSIAISPLAEPFVPSTGEFQEAPQDHSNFHLFTPHADYVSSFTDFNPPVQSSNVFNMLSELGQTNIEASAPVLQGQDVFNPQFSSPSSPSVPPLTAVISSLHAAYQQTRVLPHQNLRISTDVPAALSSSTPSSTTPYPHSSQPETPQDHPSLQHDLTSYELGMAQFGVEPGMFGNYGFDFVHDLSGATGAMGSFHLDDDDIGDCSSLSSSDGSLLDSPHLQQSLMGWSSC